MLIQNSRTGMLLGIEKMERLRSCRVAVFGLGGVGGHCVEALARSGVGKLTVVDNDTVCLTNLNRQIFATHKTLGMHKADAAVDRIADIDPTIEVDGIKIFFTQSIAEEFDFASFDYVVDAVDTVSAKIALVLACRKTATPLISSMGAANKLDATGFIVTDIYKTSVDPIAKILRRELKKLGVERLKVVYSKEMPKKPVELPSEERKNQPSGRQTPASNAWVPAAAGLILAGEVIMDLAREE